MNPSFDDLTNAENFWILDAQTQCRDLKYFIRFRHEIRRLNIFLHLLILAEYFLSRVKPSKQPQTLFSKILKMLTPPFFIQIEVFLYNLNTF